MPTIHAPAALPSVILPRYGGFEYSASMERVSIRKVSLNHIDGFFLVTGGAEFLCTHAYIVCARIQNGDLFDSAATPSIEKSIEKQFCTPVSSA